MKKLKILSMCVFLAFSFSVSFMASAHHAVQAQFAVDEFKTLTGVMTKVELINPHPYFYLDVDKGDGQVVNWAIESVALNALRTPAAYRPTSGAARPPERVAAFGELLLASERRQCWRFKA